MRRSLTKCQVSQGSAGEKQKWYFVPGKILQKQKMLPVKVAEIGGKHPRTLSEGQNLLVIYEQTVTGIKVIPTTSIL